MSGFRGEWPELTTARLHLRVHRPDDLDESAAMWGDAEVTRFIGGRPLAREEVWARLLRHVGHWVTVGYGYWVVRERASGAFVGEVGFADLRRAIEPSLDGAPEVGWALATAAQGRGYAAEALAAALAWGDVRLGAPRTVCIISPAHTRSIRLAAAAGYVEIARTGYRGDPTVVFERRTPH